MSKYYSGQLLIDIHEGDIVLVLCLEEEQMDVPQLWSVINFGCQGYGRRSAYLETTMDRYFKPIEEDDPVQEAK